MYVHEFPARPDIEQFRKQAKDLLKACQGGDSTARARVEGGSDPDQPIRLADAQRTLAREYGFASWPRFVRHVAGLTGERTDAIGVFERAADAVVEGDEAALQRLLDADPLLVKARSSRQHRATLLHYISANGVEDFRQRSPQNAPAIAELLLARGAVVDATCDSYDGHDTTMGLLVSSSHPHHAGVQVPLVHTLLDHGAAVDGIADDCSNLLTALAFQYPRAAEALEQRGARVDNILTAAGLGRLDLVRRFADTAPARLPKWLRPPLPLRSRALLWAAALDRLDVADFLSTDRDLLTAVDNQGFTPLHWAAFNGHAEMVDLLIRKGADLRARNTYGGTVLGGTLWAVANGDSTIDRTSVVRRLLAAGAVLDDASTRTGNADIDALLTGDA
jgi:Ankyrin repeat